MAEICLKMLHFETNFHKKLSYKTSGKIIILIRCIFIKSQIWSGFQLCIFDVPGPHNIIDVIYAIFNVYNDGRMVGFTSFGVMSQNPSTE